MAQPATAITLFHRHFHSTPNSSQNSLLQGFPPPGNLLSKRPLPGAARHYESSYIAYKFSDYSFPIYTLTLIQSKNLILRIRPQRIRLFDQHEFEKSMTALPVSTSSRTRFSTVSIVSIVSIVTFPLARSRLISSIRPSSYRGVYGCAWRT